MKMTKTTLAATFALIIGTNTVWAQKPSCDNKCLSDIASAYLRDVVKQDSSKLPWADQVRYTENNVAMMIGDGFWGAGPGTTGDSLLLTDPSTGNIVWYGLTTEHGQAAYHGLRLKVEGKQISEVESIVGREGTPEVFAKTDGFKVDTTFTAKVPAASRQTREQLTAVVEGYFLSKQQNNGKLMTAFSDKCAQFTNGVNTTAGDYWAAKAVQGCEAQLKAGVYKPVERIRARRYPVINEDTGVVVAMTLEDHATRYLDYTTLDGKALSVQVPYPNTRGRLDIVKVEDGKIVKIEGISVFLPYYIHSLWTE
jgi:hypothetical protein